MLNMTGTYERGDFGDSENVNYNCIDLTSFSKFCVKAKNVAKKELFACFLNREKFFQKVSNLHKYTRSIIF